MADVQYHAKKMNKGKNSNNVASFLPSLPASRTKPIWQANPPSFILSGRPPEDQVLDNPIMSELSPREAKRKRRVKSWDPVSTGGAGGSKTKGFSHPRKDREGFRNALVNIIMQEEKQPLRSPSVDGTELPPITRSSSPTAAEKDILRYYYYIHHGIDTEHVAPMEDSWLEQVLKLLAPSLKSGLDETIENLSDEMREDYLLSVKKAIVDFVLRDPREKDEDRAAVLPPHRAELDMVPKPWHRSYQAALGAVRDTLNITNPTMLQVLELWHVSFGKLRLVDIDDFHQKTESMELATFQNLVMRHIDSAKERLLKKWFPEVQNIYFQGNRKKLVPSNHSGERLEAFFNCAAALMTQQLQSLCLESMEDFTDLLCQPPTSIRAFEHSGFIIRLVLDGTQLMFEPTFSDFEIVLLNVYDVMLKAVGVVPRVETKLLSDLSESKAKAVLRPIILEDIVADHKQKIKELIEEESEKPESHIKNFDKYSFLITKQAEADVEAFLSEEHNFEDYAKEVQKYRDLMDDILYNTRKDGTEIAKEVRLGMFELHSDELVRALAKRADALCSKLLARMSRDHGEANRKLCDEYEAIAEKALTTPANTEQLMELSEYIHGIEGKEIKVLEEQLLESKDRLAFLVDYASFSPAEMRLNSSAFQWHGRLPEIFAEHKQIVEEKTSQYQDGLKLR